MMRSGRQRSVSLLVALGLGLCLASAQAPRAPESAPSPSPGRVLVLTDDTEMAHAGPYLEYHFDETGQLRLADVVGARVTVRFTQAHEERPNLGYRREPVWVRWRVRNGSRQRHWRLECAYPFLSGVDFYRPIVPGLETAASDYERTQAGTSLPLRLREEPLPRPVFRLDLPPGAEATLYLRVQGGNAMNLDLRMWEVGAFGRANYRYTLIQGLLIGCLISLALYHLLLAFTLRYLSQVFFFGFSVFAVLLYASGEGFTNLYLYPNIGPANDVLMPLYLGATMLCSYLFADRFLFHRNREQPGGWPRVVIRVVQVLWIVFLLASLFVHRIYMMPAGFVLTSVGSLAAFVVGCVVWARGYRPARYFALAWIGSVVGALLIHAARIDVIDAGFAERHTWVVGVIWMQILLAMAVAERVNEGREASAKAREIALASAKEHQKLMAEQNVLLEEKVQQRAAEFEATKNEAEAANQAKSVFLANMSHELRTPLNAILGYAQILSHSPDLNDAAKRSVRTIRKSGQHLLTLINDVLDISRIEAGRVTLDPNPTMLQELLRSVVGIIEVSAERKGIDFVRFVDSTLPPCVELDQRRVRQVLLNLLGNAVRYTSEGSVALRVHRVQNRELTPDRCLLRFEVEDTGAGISEDDIERIFRPFEQAGRPHLRAGGAGLGLAISQELVRLMGSEIKVTSTVGQGSCFAFELIAKIADSRLLSDASPSPLPNFVGDPAILVLGGDEDGRLMLADLLVPAGFRCRHAHDGEETLAIMNDDLPEAMIVDLDTPAFAGLSLLRQLRGYQQLANLPIIAISGGADEQTEAAALRSGANAHLAKPVDVVKLIFALAELLPEKTDYRPRGTPDQSSVGGMASPQLPEREELETMLKQARLGLLNRAAERADEIARADSRLRPFAGHLQALADTMQDDEMVDFLERSLAEA